MKIAIIGSGHVGKALARGLTASGHQVIIASREYEHAQKAAAETGAAAAPSAGEAVELADLAILAVPQGARADVARQIEHEIAGKTLIDVTNIADPNMDGLNSRSSGAQDVQAMLPTARVVKALNTVFAAGMADPRIDGVALDGLYAGDDVDAKREVGLLIADLGFNPIDVGPLALARALEDMALLNIRLNATNHWAWKTAWKLIGPTGTE